MKVQFVKETLTKKSGAIKVNESVHSEPYIPILLTVCDNISMKNVIKHIRLAKLLIVKSLNC